ncbi:unnamed protein product [marine sediment metagenome]|uniref:Uncharacterized protein n=1 Tax=marine sediment metagenome TaxID=412755 RepID=X1KZJ5_9ZZZZ
MRTEDEIRGRLKHWREVLGGVLKGEETKKTISHIIEELEWVLGNEPPSYVWQLGSFDTPRHLRDFLRDELAGRPRQGTFLMGDNKPQALEGSRFLFSKSCQIVGSATVKERPKSRGPEVLPGVHPEYKNMVRFIPETIDAWDDDTFVSELPEELGIDLHKGRQYRKTTADKFRKIVALHESKKRHLKFPPE